MRPFLILYSLVGLLAGLGANQRIFQVTPSTLAGWTVIGATREAVESASDLIVPAHAQIAATFPAVDLAVTAASSPYFGADPADWPVWEIGDAALVFVGNGTTGRMVLMLGDATPEELPWKIELTNGISAEPIEVTFARRGPVVSVGMSGRIQEFVTRPSSNDLQEVV